MKAVVISALSSGQGKTMFSMALMHWLKKNIGCVRPFKVGPDYIDPIFHEKITGTESVNLDLYMMSELETKNAFIQYSKGHKCSVIEGVMGFYDGMDYGSSTYEIAKAVNVPVILVISAEGLYTTIAPILMGILDYRADNMIKGVILNRVSSESHFKSLEKIINSEIPNLRVLGWIEKEQEIISSRHLGLDLTEIDNEKLNEITEKVMKNIRINELLDVIEVKGTDAPLVAHQCLSKNIAIVRDKAFCFTYKQNIDYLEQVFNKKYYISALNNDEIPADTDVVYIPGGYVETLDVASILDKASKFKSSLREFAVNPGKRIYAECAGMMFLGNKIQTTDGKTISGCGILPMDFEMQAHRNRLGYYRVKNADYKGHSFHYSKPVHVKAIEKWELYKEKDGKTSGIGAWANKTGNVFGTYLHTMFFNQPELVSKYLIGEKND